ncbi:MAG: dephospho-CoA kinase [Firmicutes bacterium]|nr:dephospho-CoA kinase [Bacillota bacterium]
MRIAITGGIAGGKSEAGRILAAAGARVTDADAVYHRMIEPGGACFDAVTGLFGDAVLDAGGRIDRRKVAGIVFNDAEKRAALERATHPLIRSELLALTAGDGVFFALVPLLCESGTASDFDVVWTVEASVETRIKRIVRRDHIGESAVKKILAAQVTEAERAAVAHTVIRNDGTLSGLKEKVLKEYEKIRDKYTY